MDTITMSNYNADHGRVSLAMDRLIDLETELGKNPRICYAEGLLWSFSLGQGIKAFECFVEALKLDPNYENAAVNATEYATNEKEYTEYSGIAARLSPDRKVYINEKIGALHQGTQYWEILLNERDGRESIFCAKVELALASGTLPPDKELDCRRSRFEILRNIDLADQRLRESKGEAFPADERLALHEALLELDRAIALDPYDATFWNYKAAWCRLLGRFEEGLLSADEAIKLRPTGYHRPYHNKAIIYSDLGKIPEAIACAKEALAQLELSTEKNDIPVIQKMIGDLAAPQHPVTLDDFIPVMQQVVLSAREEMTQLAGQTKDDRASLEKMIELTEYRIHNLHPSPDNALHYVPSMAQILANLTPETVFLVLQEMKKTNGVDFENCITATLYIAAYEEKIMQRDALRLLILTLFANVASVGSAEKVREQYRELILDVSAAAMDEMADLDQLMRKEIARIHPDLPKLIADQDPSDEEGKEKARELILSRLEGTPYIVDSGNPSTTPPWLGRIEIICSRCGSSSVTSSPENLENYHCDDCGIWFEVDNTALGTMFSGKLSQAQYEKLTSPTAFLNTSPTALVISILVGIGIAWLSNKFYQPVDWYEWILIPMLILFTWVKILTPFFTELSESKTPKTVKGDKEIKHGVSKLCLQCGKIAYEGEDTCQRCGSTMLHLM
jgi:tetratricopeptide (TPR) repeat protein